MGVIIRTSLYTLDKKICQIPTIDEKLSSKTNYTQQVITVILYFSVYYKSLADPKTRFSPYTSYLSQDKHNSH